MYDNKVAFRYAKSLFDVALSNQNLEEVYNDMVNFAATCSENKELAPALKSPIVTSKQKSNLLLKVFASYEKEILNFFELVASKNRAGVLPHIAAQFISLYNEHNGILEVSVSSAQALTDKERKDIIAYLEKQTGAKDIKMAETVDSSIIGGLVIKYGDSLIDSSVLSQINNIKKELQIV